MPYMTDEAMDEFAQWQHDESLTVPEVEIPTEADVEAFEIECLTQCLNGQHSTIRFEIVSGRFTFYCEDGCR